MEFVVIIIIMDWTFNEEIGILEISRASFPTLDEIVWQKIHSYSEKKKVGVVQRTRVVLERRE